MSADALANAIVASSLASSRPPLPTRSSKSSSSSSLLLLNPPHRAAAESTRTPSPSKPMRKTLRGPSPPPRKDDDHHRRANRKPHLLTHPNKHAEGDRKRWRDEISEAERKRYEGLWAANRGLLLLPPPLDSGNEGGGGKEEEGEVEKEEEEEEGAKDCVADLVVKDIWRRSQLSDGVLAEVWDLVDGRRRRRRLTREEFVVGTWLVDQCLRGRKLPAAVSESVWSSVRRLRGIRIPGG